MDKTMVQRQKYGSRVTYVDGIRFASKREAERYAVLALRLKDAAEPIRNLMRQVPYQLNAATTQAPGYRYVGKYVADFVYVDHTGQTHVEDAKGYSTPLYKWKRKHFEAEYGLKIEEV